MRSDPHVMDDDVTRSGIISACAERSFRSVVTDAGDKDHLRVCGAIDVVPIMASRGEGSSPRVRSDQLYFIGIWSGWMVRNV